MIKKKSFLEASLEMAKKWGDAEFMDDGLVLTDQMILEPFPQEPIRLNFILMALCLDGEAQYTIDTRQQSVKPDNLLFVSERHVLDNYTASPDFKCLCIMVSTQFYHSFVQNVKNVSSLLLFSMNYPVVQLTPRETEVFKNYYQIIRDKMVDEQHHFRTELIKSLLLAMFYDMSNVIYRMEQMGGKAQTRADVIFSKFVRLLEQNFRSERRVSWYAKQMCITPKYLSEMVKQVSKHTPNEWIDYYVILELRSLLKNSSKSIKEIAEELNFPNQSFLGKYFKEHVGINPSSYRKN